MSSFKKQLLFILIAGAVITAGALGIRAVGNIKIPSGYNQTGAGAPIAWWKMDEASWNGTAGEVIDATGNGNNGTSTNGANTTSTAVFGRAGSFDGVNDYVDINYPSLQITGEVTIGAWIKTTTIASGARQIVCQETGGSGNNWYFDINRTAAKVQIGWSGSTRLTSTGSLTTNQWYYVNFVRSGSAGAWIVKIYINGVLDSTSGTITSNPTSGTTHRIGNNGSLGQPFDGLIDDVRIYGRALGAQEVAQMYNSTKDGYLGNIKMSTGLVGYWKMDDNLDTTAVRDYSGKNNNGVFTDATGNPFTTAHTTTTAQIGRAMVFDGVDDWVSVGNNSSFQVGSGNFTVSWWGKANNSGKMVSKRYTAWEVGVDAIKFTGYYGIVSSPYWREFTPDNILHRVDVAQWNFYTIIGDVVNTKRLKFYSNGVYRGQTSGTAKYLLSVYDGCNLEFGRRSGSAGTSQFNGLIDDVKIYNYARSAEQIANDYIIGSKHQEE